jgi:hypothetical protein
MGAAVALLALVASPAAAHCDTLDGPVVAAARVALASGNPTAALAWVKPEGESEVRHAFAEALAVKRLGGIAADLADRWFFETLVRVHRSGEGAPYTGLKPAGGEKDPVIAAVDHALEKENVDTLSHHVIEGAESGIRTRFREAVAPNRISGRDLVAGRAAVAAYVEFVHYVKALHAAIEGHAGHAGETEAATAPKHVD